MKKREKEKKEGLSGSQSELIGAYKLHTFSKGHHPLMKPIIKFMYQFDPSI